MSCWVCPAWQTRGLGSARFSLAQPIFCLVQPVFFFWFSPVCFGSAWSGLVQPSLVPFKVAWSQPAGLAWAAPIGIPCSGTSGLHSHTGFVSMGHTTRQFHSPFWEPQLHGQSSHVGPSHILPAHPTFVSPMGSPNYGPTEEASQIGHASILPTPRALCRPPIVTPTLGSLRARLHLIEAFASALCIAERVIHAQRKAVLFVELHVPAVDWSSNMKPKNKPNREAGRTKSELEKTRLNQKQTNKNQAEPNLYTGRARVMRNPMPNHPKMGNLKLAVLHHAG